MTWIPVSEKFPPVDKDTGESVHVFVYPGHRCFPRIACYSNGMWSHEGWHPADDLGETIPVHVGRGKKIHLSFTHWAYIELPKEEMK